MRTTTVNLYKFSELSDEAQARAREWFRDGNEYGWWHESLASVKAFCDEFGVSVGHYEVGTCCYSYINTDAENEHFRGRKLSAFDREAMPTGYCLDNTLRYTFADEWKKTGSPKLAFEAAINEAVDDIVRDMEYQNSDECVDEMLTINEYEFTEDGKIY